ncbi:MAG: hypothetical protein Q8L85_05515 [Alphaproteobacteria bacterium]|nr:hypothetical protein [Alphaproteobacteria bacterium]
MNIKKINLLVCFVFFIIFINSINAEKSKEDFNINLAELEVNPLDSLQDKAEKIFKMSLLLDLFAIKDLYFKGFVEEAEELLHMISAGYKMVVEYYRAHPLAELFYEAHRHPSDDHGLPVEGDPKSMVAISGLYTDGIQDDVPDDYVMQAFWLARSAEKTQFTLDGQDLLAKQQKISCATLSAKEFASLIAFVGGNLATGYGAGRALAVTLNQEYLIIVGLCAGAVVGSIEWVASLQLYMMFNRCKERRNHKKNVEKLNKAFNENEDVALDLDEEDSGCCACFGLCRKSSEENLDLDPIEEKIVQDNKNLEKLIRHQKLSTEEKNNLKTDYLIHRYRNGEEDEKFIELFDKAVNEDEASGWRNCFGRCHKDSDFDLENDLLAQRVIQDNENLGKLIGHQKLSKEEQKFLKTDYLRHLYGKTEEDKKFIELYNKLTKSKKNKNDDQSVDEEENDDIDVLQYTDHLLNKKREEINNDYLKHLYGGSAADKRFVEIYRKITRNDRIEAKNEALQKHLYHIKPQHKEGIIKRFSNVVVGGFNKINPFYHSDSHLKNDNIHHELDENGDDIEIHVDHDDKFALEPGDDNIIKAQKIFNIALQLDNFAIKKLHFKGHLKEAEKLMYMVALGYKMAISYNPLHPYAQLFYDAHDHQDVDGSYIRGNQMAQKVISGLFSDYIEEGVPDDKDAELYWIGRSLEQVEEKIESKNHTKVRKAACVIGFTARNFGSLCATEISGLVGGYALGNVMASMLNATYWVDIGVGVGGVAGFAIWLGGFKFYEAYYSCTHLCQHNHDLKTLHQAYKVDVSNQLKMEEFDGGEIKSKKTIEEIMEESIGQGCEIKMPHQLSTHDENALREKFVQRLYKYGANDTFVRCYLEYTKTKRIDETHKELTDRLSQKKHKRRSWYSRYVPFQSSEDEA